MKFEDLHLNEKTLASLARLNYLEPTEVQAKAIPAIIAGQNLMVRSQTGTGKTAAFGIGILERLATRTSRKALVLTPTRELALQVCTEVRSIGQFLQFRILAVYGGEDIERQLSGLRGGVDFLVATPGRLLDLCRRGAVRIGDFDVIILDEADMMLDMGFIDEVSEILDQLPHKRLSIMVSATLEPEILQIASKYITNATTIEVGQKEVASTVTEHFVEASDREKLNHLIGVLHSHKGMKILVFRQTKRGADKLHMILQDRGFQAGVLHGDLSQSRRNATLKAFKEGKITMLVATNVAARGLHIDNLGLIVNYDRADSEETHLHRVGRTGRMGMEGKAITFVQRKESVEERMDSSHPDFAWMRGGGAAAYSSRGQGTHRGERGGRPGGHGGRPREHGGNQARPHQGAEHRAPEHVASGHRTYHTHGTPSHGGHAHAPRHEGHGGGHGQGSHESGSGHYGGRGQGFHRPHHRRRPRF